MVLTMDVGLDLPSEYDWVKWLDLQWDRRLGSSWDRNWVKWLDLQWVVPKESLMDSDSVMPSVHPSVNDSDVWREETIDSDWHWVTRRA